MIIKKMARLHGMALVSFFTISTFACPAYANSKAEAEIAAEVSESGELVQGDTGMSCDQIANEVVELDRIIRTARISQKNSDNTGTGVTVARTVGSLLIGSLGGVVGIAAVGALAGEAVDNKGEKAAVIEENAEERQNRLAGVFEGKGCDGELALTEETPDDVAATEPAAGPSQKYKQSPKPRYND